MGEGLNRQFTKENIWMQNKHLKKWLTSLVFRESQIKSNKLLLISLIKLKSKQQQH